jgi:hypothetical protein
MMSKLGAIPCIALVGFLITSVHHARAQYVTSSQIFGHAPRKYGMPYPSGGYDYRGGPQIYGYARRKIAVPPAVLPYPSGGGNYPSGGGGYGGGGYDYSRGGYGGGYWSPQIGLPGDPTIPPPVPLGLGPRPNN